jgi:hypothetical protein
MTGGAALSQARGRVDDVKAAATTRPCSRMHASAMEASATAKTSATTAVEATTTGVEASSTSTAMETSASAAVETASTAPVGAATTTATRACGLRQVCGQKPRDGAREDRGEHRRNAFAASSSQHVFLHPR